MTKEQWAKQRINQDMPLSVFYEYFKELKPNVQIDEHTFEQKFTQYLQRTSMMPYPNTQGIPVKPHMPTIIHKIHNYYDDKFGYERNRTEEGS